jgi:hypothetical protein
MRVYETNGTRTRSVTVGIYRYCSFCTPLACQFSCSVSNTTDNILGEYSILTRSNLESSKGPDGVTDSPLTRPFLFWDAALTHAVRLWELGKKQVQYKIVPAIIHPHPKFWPEFN